MDARINEYANCMFKHDSLPEAWIRECTKYLTYIFKDSITGATVVDYAFGRGNWSLAFLRAGAKKVIAIDASIDNVNRFTAHCKKNLISNIEIHCANLLSDSLRYNGDIVWLYGILHHIEELSTFLKRIPEIAAEHAKIFTYYYPALSPRQFIVTTCRQHLHYAAELDFTSDSHLFTRKARLRARDDLTAPYIDWATKESFASTLRQHSIRPVQYITDFFYFQNGFRNQEFTPHQFLCALNQENFDQHTATFKTEPGSDHDSKPLQHDLQLLQIFATAIFDNRKLSKTLQTKIAIGLFNSHFSINAGNNIEEVLIEDFLFLAHIIISYQIPIEDPFAQVVLLLLHNNLNGNFDNTDSSMLNEFSTTTPSIICDFLRTQTCRI